MTARRKDFPPLSPEERAKRKPLPVAVLLDARQDRAYTGEGKGRLIKATPVRKVKR